MDKKTFSNLLLNIDKQINFEYGKKCRFTMFVRLRPGYVSHFAGQVRTWSFRGDKYTDQESKMLKNLLNLLKNKFQFYDRIIIYDHHKTVDEKEIVKIVDGVVSINKLHRYSHILENYSLPNFLK